MPGDAFEELEAARAAVVAEGAMFVEELEPILRESLHAGVERLQVAQADRVARIGGAGAIAFDDAVEHAIEVGVARVVDRLRTPDIWIAPLTAPDMTSREEPGWSMDVPGWIARALRDRNRARRPGLGSLDDPANRIWVAVCAAAAPLEPVLREFGFRPGRRRLGGGSFGVQAASLPQLDPSGALGRRWKRYRSAYGRMVALAEAGDGEAAGSGSPGATD